MWDRRASLACISKCVARSLYDRPRRIRPPASFLLPYLSLTTVWSIVVRRASKGSKNSKSLSGSGNRSFQISTMLSSVLKSTRENFNFCLNEVVSGLSHIHATVARNDMDCGNWILKCVKQSDKKLKPITTSSLTFSRASNSWPVFTLGSHWLMMMSTFILTCCCDYFSLCFKETERKPALKLTNLFIMFPKFSSSTMHCNRVSEGYTLRTLSRLTCAISSMRRTLVTHGNDLTLPWLDNWLKDPSLL